MAGPKAKRLAQQRGVGLVLRLEELERDVIEGVGHTGRAAVVQLVARSAT